MACCPLCGEEVQVSTTGPQGLKQHQGKKKCLQNIEKKKKDEQNGMNLTLFSFLRCQDKGKTTDARITREAESSSRIVVGPSIATQLPESAARDDNTVGARKVREEGGSSVDKKRLKGHQDGWFQLDRLHAAIGNIPSNISEGKQGDELAGYNQSATLTICAEITLDELWENVNPSLDRMLGFGGPKNQIREII